jgi:hypothetical protein
MSTITMTLPGDYGCVLTASPGEDDDHVFVTRSVLVPAGCDGPGGEWDDITPTGPTAGQLSCDREFRRTAVWHRWEWDTLVASRRDAERVRAAAEDAELSRRCREYVPPPEGWVVTPDGRRMPREEYEAVFERYTADLGYAIPVLFFTPTGGLTVAGTVDVWVVEYATGRRLGKVEVPEHFWLQYASGVHPAFQWPKGIAPASEIVDADQYGCGNATIYLEE